MSIDLPELPYAIDALEDTEIAIRMTLTSPGCPVAGILPGQVARAVEGDIARAGEALKGANSARIWDQAASSSSATIMGMEVITFCPNSGFGDRMVTTPVSPIFT